MYIMTLVASVLFKELLDHETPNEKLSIPDYLKNLIKSFSKYNANYFFYQKLESDFSLSAIYMQHFQHSRYRDLDRSVVFDYLNQMDLDQTINTA